MNQMTVPGFLRLNGLLAISEGTKAKRGQLYGPPAGLGRGGDGGDCTDCAPLDPYTYWAKQWQLSQYSCPRCGPLGAPQPVDVYASLSTAQQQWVLAALQAWLNAPSTLAWFNVNSGSCPNVSIGMTVSPSNLGAVVNCFQAFFNAQKSQGGAITTGGTLDQITLSALMATAATNGSAPCPGNCAITPSTGAPASSSTTAWVIGGVVAVALIGGIWYAASHSRHAA